MSDLVKIRSAIERDGYFVFDTPLSPDACDRLQEMAEQVECQLVDPLPSAPKTARYDRENLIAATYHPPAQVTWAHPDVQALASDLSILGVSQAYLGSAPVVTAAIMWWSPTFSKQASDNAAQLYHFDMDSAHWLKWFVYLKDVDTNDGPHTLIRGSHKRNAKPEELLRRGYARVSDAEMAQFYSPQDHIEILGRRGTIAVVDTRTFHKGKLPSGGERLILEFRISSGVAGVEHITPRTEVQTAHQQLLERMKQYPRMFALYT